MVAAGSPRSRLGGRTGTRRSDVLCRKSGAREDFRSSFASRPPAFTVGPAMPPCQDPRRAVGLGRRKLQYPGRLPSVRISFRRGLLALPVTFARAHSTLVHSLSRPPSSPRERPLLRAIPTAPANLAIRRDNEKSAPNLHLQPTLCTSTPWIARFPSARLSPSRPRHESRRARSASQRRTALRRSDPRWQGRWTRPSSFGPLAQRGPATGQGPSPRRFQHAGGTRRTSDAPCRTPRLPVKRAAACQNQLPRPRVHAGGSVDPERLSPTE